MLFVLADVIAATHASWQAAVRADDRVAAQSCAEHLEWLAREAVRTVERFSDPGARQVLRRALVAVADDIPSVATVVRAAGW